MASNLWLPQMVKAMGFSNIETGFIVALPYLVAMVAMVVLGHVQRPQRRARLAHVAGGAFARRCGLSGAVLLHIRTCAVIAALCRGGLRHLCGAGGVLDPADSLPARHGGGGRAGAAQFLLQSGRLLRALP